MSKIKDFKLPAGFIDGLERMAREHKFSACHGMVEQLASRIKRHPDVCSKEIDLQHAKNFRQNFCYLAATCFQEMLEEELEELEQPPISANGHLITGSPSAWLKMLMEGTAGGKSFLGKANKKAKKAFLANERRRANMK